MSDPHRTINDKNQYPLQADRTPQIIAAGPARANPCARRVQSDCQ
jgi:hypothetical protein